MVTPEQIEDLVKIVFANYTSYARNNEFGTVCDLYYLMFKDEDYSQILANLKEYMKKNEFAPKPKDLLSRSLENNSVVPDVEETRNYLDSLEPKDKPTKEEILKMAREAGLDV